LGDAMLRFRAMLFLMSDSIALSVAPVVSGWLGAAGSSCTHKISSL
jgi:hypothetical protein